MTYWVLSLYRLCLKNANVCILGRKRLQPQFQTFATAIANVCGEKYISKMWLALSVQTAFECLFNASIYPYVHAILSWENSVFGSSKEPSTSCR